MKKKVLIVESDRNMSRYMAIMLNLKGFEVRIASNEEEAGKIMEGKRPDLIVANAITDKSTLPAMESDLSIRHIPLIIVTSPEKKFIEKRNPSLACADYVNAPFSPRDFLSKVEKITSQSMTLL